MVYSVGDPQLKTIVTINLLYRSYYVSFLCENILEEEKIDGF